MAQEMNINSILSMDLSYLVAIGAVLIVFVVLIARKFFGKENKQQKEQHGVEKELKRISKQLKEQERSNTLRKRRKVLKDPSESTEEDEARQAIAADEKVGKAGRSTGPLITKEEIGSKSDELRPKNEIIKLTDRSILVSCGADGSVVKSSHLVKENKSVEPELLSEHKTVIAEQKSFVRSIGCCKDGTAFGTQQGELYFIEKDNKLCLIDTFVGPISCVRFANEQIVIIGDGDGMVSVINVVEKRILRSFQAHDMAVTGIDFIDDKIYTCSADELAREFDSNCNQTTIYSGHTDKLTDLFVFGDRVVTSSFDETVKIWERNPKSDFGEDSGEEAEKEDEEEEEKFWNEKKKKQPKKKTKKKTQPKKKQHSYFHSRVLVTLSECPQGAMCIKGYGEKTLKYVFVGCGDGSIRIFSASGDLIRTVINKSANSFVWCISLALNPSDSDPLKSVVYSGHANGQIRTTVLDEAESVVAYGKGSKLFTGAVYALYLVEA